MSTEQRCRTCRHWEDGPYEDDTEGSPHGCHSHDMGHYLPYDKVERHRPGELTVEFSHGSCHPRVWTQPEFGCVHWEEKPK